MATKLPEIGAHEDIRTEFKRAEKLRKPEERRDLVRAVVAMRNSMGGRVWVGLVEKDELLVGLDPLAPQDRPHVTSLRDQILDRVEPSLVVGQHVRLEELRIGESWVLCIEVEPKPADARYHCFKDGNRREFLRRVDGRIQSIPFEELFGPSNASSLETETRKAHDEWTARFPGVPGLAFTSLPSACLRQQVESALQELPAEWVDAIESPPLEIAPRHGWSWSVSRHERPKRLSSEATLVSGSESGREPYRNLRLTACGRLQYFTALTDFAWGGDPHAERHFPGRVAGQIFVGALIQTVAYLVRLVAHLEKVHSLDPDGSVGIQLGLNNRRGWVMLRTPTGIEWGTQPAVRAHWWNPPQDDLTSEVIERSSRDLSAEPDRVSFRLLSWLLERDDRSEPVEAIPWYKGNHKFLALS